MTRRDWGVRPRAAGDPPSQFAAAMLREATVAARAYHAAMTLTEAAALLGLKPGTLNVQARRGRLRAKKLGRDWHVTPAEVERYRREVLGKPGWKGKA